MGQKISNGGFELGFAGWALTAGVQPDNTGVDPPHTGTKACYAHYNGSDYDAFTITQTLAKPIRSEDIARLSIWVSFASSGDGHEWGVTYSDASQTLHGLDANTDWIEDVIIPDAGKLVESVSIIMTTNPSPSSFVTDDASLDAITAWLKMPGGMRWGGGG